MPDTLEPPKKRTKTGKSCLTCRKKKIKCDKQKPVCSYCSKHYISHKCKYDDGEQDIPIIQQSKLSPYSVESDLSNLLNTSIHYPPLNITLSLHENLTRNDPNGFSIIDAKKPLSVLSYESLIQSNEILIAIFESINFKKLVNFKKLKDDILNKYSSHESQNNLNKCLDYERDPDKPISHNKELNSLFELSSFKDIETELKSLIREMLPPLQHVWKSIDYFFKHSYLHGFISFIDENSFRKKVSLVLLDEEIKINKKTDFATVGIVLIILRLSYIYAKFSCSTAHNQNEFNEAILSKPISIEIVKLAHICSNLFCKFRHVNFEVLQFNTLIRSYHFFAPEDGDGLDGGESQTFAGLLFQSALSIGLNKKPSDKDFKAHPKLSNIWQKLWLEIKNLDYYQAIYFGNPSSINNEIQDNFLSHSYTLSNANNNDYSFEDDVYNFQLLRQKIIKEILPSLNKVLNFNTEMSLNQDNELLIKIDSLLHELRLIQISCDIGFLKMSAFLSSLELKNLKFSLVFKIYNKLTSTNHLSFPYLKILLQLSNEFNSYENLNVTDEFGSKASLLIVSPILQNTLHKSKLFEVSILFKLLVIKNDHFYKNTFIIDTLISQYLTNLEQSIDYFKSNSKDYYYSWFLTKVFMFIWKNYLNSGVLKAAKSLKLIEKLSPLPNDFKHLLHEEFVEVLEIFELKQPSISVNTIPQAAVATFLPISPVSTESAVSLELDNPSLDAIITDDILNNIDKQWVEQLFTYSPYNNSNDEISNFYEFLNS
ncbi:hypothetical protein WICMUC_004096 [Wickerhamomyces mucosus]|uniref:Zn(2)-C6 fungal-type domain-containing protein n=1 Tax=Wickerhamomyces mucosus TaxID=1378264 RepID=A0A9P8PJD2_9ASCO|nr:hypothetical protein WICMUC_004096 [Wickerhamomyces mucosus]